jgi:hypothetical protein
MEFKQLNRVTTLVVVIVLSLALGLAWLRSV